LIGPEFFVLVFVSHDCELDQNLSGDFQEIFSSDLNEIWYVGRGRRVMHDGMPYGRNQGQGQGHSREVDRQSPNGTNFFINFVPKTHRFWDIRLVNIQLLFSCIFYLQNVNIIQITTQLTMINGAPNRRGNPLLKLRSSIITRVRG